MLTLDLITTVTQCFRLKYYTTTIFRLKVSFAAGSVLIKTEILSFVLKQKPSTPPNLMMEMQTIWELCLFQVGPSVSL